MTRIGCGGWGLIGAALVAASARGGSTLYVDDGAGAGGTGESWQAAFRHLQDALVKAAPGMEIRVAGGSYRPDRSDATPAGSGDRAASFALLSGVAISGGWAGPGTPDPDVRDPDLYATILSGDLAGDDLPGFVNIAENSHHVVIADGVDGTAVLDGVTIRGGNADTLGAADSGGALLAVNSAPAINHCRFEGNRALQLGGAVHATPGSAPTFVGCSFSDGEALRGGLMYAQESLFAIRESSLSIGVAEAGGAVYVQAGALVMTDCALTDNLATEGDSYTSYGGAIYASGDLTLEGCTFTGNVAVYGGCAVYAAGGSAAITGCTFTGNGGGPQGSSGGAIYAQTDLQVTACAFTSNTAEAYGGAVYLYNFFDSIATITDCSFTDNEAQEGGAVGHSDAATLAMSGCTFTGNRAINGRGGAYASSSYDGSIAIANCWFEGNWASQHGGAVSLSQGALASVLNSTFVGNSAAYYGGAVHIHDASGGEWITFTACVFRANGANVGGALYSLESSPLIIASRIVGNTATAWGGAMYNGFSDTVLSGTLIHGNTAALRGGGIHNFRCDPTLTGCTLTHNIAGNDGGGIYNQVECFPTVENCIVWGNDDGGPADYGAQIYDDPGSVTACGYSCLQGWLPASPGEGIVAANPMLADAAGPDGTIGTADDDLSLLAGSPAIDAGRNGAVPEWLLLDLAGNPRFADDAATSDTGCGSPGLVDMGAYEFMGVPLAPLPGDLDGTRSVGINDLLALMAAWGPCDAACCLADIDGSGVVGLDDLFVLLEEWQ